MSPSPSHPVFPERFHRFWFGQGLSYFATQINMLLISATAITLLQANNTQVGILNAAQTLAFLLLGLPAGALVDRWRKKPILVLTSILRLIAMAYVSYAWWNQTLTVNALILVSTLLGFATIFFDIAGQTAIPLMAGRSLIPPANARLEATFQISRIAGLGVAGWLLGAFSPTIAYAVPAVLFAACAWVLATIPDQETLPTTHKKRIIDDIGEGIRFVRSQPLLAPLFLCIAWAALTSQGIFILTPVLGLKHFGMSPDVLGILMALSALGGIAGSISYRWFILHWGIGRSISWCFTIQILSTLGLSIAAYTGFHPWIMFTICSTVAAFFNTIYNITQMSLRQVLAPLDLLGRVNATFRFIVWGTMPIGSLLAGWFADAVGTVNAFTWICLISLTAGVAMALTPTGKIHAVEGMGTPKDRSSAQ